LMLLFTDILLSYLPFFKANLLHLNILSKNIYKSGDRYKLLNYPLTQALGIKACSSYFYYKNGVVPSERLENFISTKVTNKADVWALGCVFYEAVFGVVPFGATDREELLILLENTIKNKKTFLNDLPNPKGVPVKPELQDLLEHMLQFYPDDRMDFAEVLRHSFLQKKKKDVIFYVTDYFKQMKFNLDNDKDIFQTLDSGFKTSLKTCFDLCEMDPLKLTELDMLEVFKNLPNRYGYSCDMAHRMILLETLCDEPYEKKHGDFPYKTRVFSSKTLPCGQAFGESDLPAEGESDEENKTSETPKIRKDSTKNSNKNNEGLLEVKAGFKDKMSHEWEIIRFVEEIVPSLRQVLDLNENLSNLMGFILSKYLFIRVEFMRSCLMQKENLFNLENWQTQIMYLNFDNWLDSLKRASGRAYQNMNSNFENILISQIKDKKVIPFVNFDFDVTKQDEKTYVRVFLKLVLDVKDLLEKKNQKVLSKFGYGVILKLFYFVSIYEIFGFFKMDRENKFNIISMTQNVVAMDKEKMKKEIVDFLKTFLQKE